MQEALSELKESFSKLREELTKPNRESMTGASEESATLSASTTTNEDVQFAMTIKRLEKKVSEQEKLILQLGVTNPRNCEEIKSKDSTKESGMYWIDPDGHGIGDDPIYVFCNMTTGNILYLMSIDQFLIAVRYIFRHHLYFTQQ